MRAFYYRVDAVDEVVGAEGDDDGDDDERNHGGERTEGVAILVLSLGSFCSLFLLLNIIEQMVMGVELEKNVKNVEEEKNEGSATRQELNVWIVFGDLVVALLRYGRVKSGGDDQGCGADSHKRGHGRSNSRIKTALSPLDSSGEEATAEDLFACQSAISGVTGN